MRAPLVLLALLLVGCRDTGPASSEHAAPKSHEEATPPPAAPPSEAVTPAAPAPVPPAVEAALVAIRSKQRCNRVMGCPPAVTLRKAGTSAVPAILEALTTTSGESYFRPVLVELLGHIGDPAAAPLLRSLLADDLWLMRAQAAIALGRLRDAEAAPLLEKLLLASPPETAGAERAAAAFALVFMGQRDNAAALVEVLTPEAVRTRNWGYTTIAVDLARELRLRDALPGIRVAATHDDVFLRKAALVALGDLGERSDAGLLVASLDHTVPSVRAAATAALERLTGKRHRDAAAWRAWCDAEPSCRS